MLSIQNTSTLVLTSALLFGCGGAGESGSPEHDQIATGVGALMADSSGGQRVTFADAVFALRGTLGTGLSLDSPGVVTGQRGEMKLKYEFTCKDASDAVVATCPTAASADVKVEWKGKIDDTRYKLEIDRKGDWKIVGLTSEVATADGHTSYSVKSDFKDKSEDLRYKYDFDFDTKYRAVQIRLSDGALVGGTADFDLDAKQKSEDGMTVLKTHTKMRTIVEFTPEGEALISLESKFKYKLDLGNGEVTFEEKIE